MASAREPRRAAPSWGVWLLCLSVTPACYASRRLPNEPLADDAGVDGGREGGVDGGVDAGRDAGSPPPPRSPGAPYVGDACLLWSEQPLLGLPGSVVATDDGFFLSSPVQRFDGTAWDGWPLTGPVLLGPDGLVALDADRRAVGFWDGVGWDLVSTPAGVGAPTAATTVEGRLVVGGASGVAVRDGADWTVTALPDGGALLTLGALRVGGRERIVAALDEAVYWLGDDGWNGIAPFRGVVDLGGSRTSPLFAVRVGELFEVLPDGLRRVRPGGDTCRPASIVASPERVLVICGEAVLRWVGRDADDDGPRDGWRREGTLPRDAVLATPSVSGAGRAFGVDLAGGGIVGRLSSDREGPAAPWRWAPGRDALERLPTEPAPPARAIAGDPRGVPLAGGDGGVFRVEDGPLVPEPGTEGWPVRDLWVSPAGVAWAVTQTDPAPTLQCRPGVSCEAGGFRCLPGAFGALRCVPRVEVHRRDRDGVWRLDLTVFPTPETSGLLLDGVGELPRLASGCGVRVRNAAGAWSPLDGFPDVVCGSDELGGEPEEQLVRGALAAAGDVLVFGQPGALVFDPDAVRVNPHVRYDLAAGTVDTRFDDAASWRASLLGEPGGVLLDRETGTLWIDGADGLVRSPAPEGQVFGGGPGGDVLLHRADPSRFGLWSPATRAFDTIARDGFARVLAAEAPGGERAIVNGDAILATTRVDEAWFLRPASPPLLLHCPPGGVR